MSGGYLLNLLNGGSLFDSTLPLIPTRETIVYMNNDLNEWGYAGADDDYADAAQDSEPENLTPSVYNALRNSQHVIFQRQAPGYTFSCDCTVGSSPTLVIRLSEDKEIRCFNFVTEGTFPDTGLTVDYAVFPITLYTDEAISTMCIRTGSGWVGNNVYSQFYLGNSSSSRPDNVNVYSSDRAIYLNSSTYACVADRTAINTTSATGTCYS